MVYFLLLLLLLCSLFLAVGGIMGFSLVFAGAKGVNWNKKTPDFPYVSGFVPVVMSWFISPVAAALVSGIIFLIIRTLVLRRQNSTKVAIWVSNHLGSFASGLSALWWTTHLKQAFARVAA
jgi:phosphate/sulfate permease